MVIILFGLQICIIFCNVVMGFVICCSIWCACMMLKLFDGNLRVCMLLMVKLIVL